MHLVSSVFGLLCLRLRRDLTALYSFQKKAGMKGGCSPFPGAGYTAGLCDLKAFSTLNGSVIPECVMEISGITELCMILPGQTSLKSTRLLLCNLPFKTKPVPFLESFKH